MVHTPCLKTLDIGEPASGISGLVTFDFLRSQRLLSAEDYKNVFDHNDFRASHKKVLMLALTSNKPKGRLGLVFGKKNIPRSVDRNRFKRITREQFRLQSRLAAGLDIIVMARTTLAEMDNQTYAALIRKLMEDVAQQRARKQKNDLSHT
jgi:ribonuclease P protein component